MKNIECAIEGTAAADGSADSLRIEGFGDRLRIAVRNLEPGKDSIAFDLLIGYQLAYEYGNAIKNVINALVLTLEQPGTGAAGALRLGDPDVRPVSPNFSGPPTAAETATAFFGGSCGLQIVALTEPREASPLYLRVCLRQLVSNCLALDTVAKISMNYEGK